MVNVPLSFGYPPPESPLPDSAIDRLSFASKLRPTTGQVVGSYVEETFEGVGSFAQDIDAMNIRRSQERDAPLLEDDWKQSQDYRKGVGYHPTMTAYEAKILAERYDQRTDNELVQSKASGLQSAAGMGVGFLSGIGEPKNFVSGVAAALLTAGVGAVIPSVGRVIATNSIKTAAGRGALEGVAGAAMTEPLSISSAKQLQDDYTFADSLMNVALSSVLGAGLGAGGKALELRAEGKQKAIAEAYQAERGLAVKELDTALAQTVQGSAIDVASVKQLDNAEKAQAARQELPRIEEKLAVAKEELDTRGLGEQYHGTSTPIEKLSDYVYSDTNYYGSGFYTTDAIDVAKGYSKKGRGGEPTIYKFTPNKDTKVNLFDMESPISREKIQELKLPQELIDTHDDIKANYDKEPNMREIYDEAREFLTSEGYDRHYIQEIYDSARYALEEKGYTGLKHKGGLLTNKKPHNVEIYFNPTVDSKLQLAVNDIIRIGDKKAQTESAARIQTDNAPIKKLQDDLAKPDNSTAYNPDDAANVQKYLDDAGEMEDQIRMEQEYEELAGEIAEMKSQGLLSKDELDILESLSNIDKDSAIYENILNNAKICLTRG